MAKDLWHYPRTALAEQVLGMFETGLSSALVFFAPRRMGKTEFLCKDILPYAENCGWKVFYFSFLDVGANATAEFTKSLANFTKGGAVLAKTGSLLKRVSKVSGEAAGIKAGLEFNETVQAHENMKDLIARLATRDKIILLMDEVQILAQNSANANFVAALRTALDIHKDNVKVIFTGSSQEGLRRMFSQAKAPFFHFGQNLPFPELDNGFTEHLAQVFKKVTGRELNADILWTIFKEMQKIPQLARALVERIALNPALTLIEAKKQLLTDVFADRAFVDIWERCTALEQLLLREISMGVVTLFSVDKRKQFANALGINSLSVSSIQSALRVLQRKNLIGRFPERGGYLIDDPNFKNWLLQDKE